MVKRVLTSIITLTILIGVNACGGSSTESSSEESPNVSWEDFIEEVKTGDICCLSYDVNTGFIYAEDWNGASVALVGPLDLSSEEQLTLLNNVDLLETIDSSLENPREAERKPCNRFSIPPQELLLIGYINPNSFPVCIVSHGSYKVSAAGNSGCTWNVGAVSYNEQIIGMTYTEDVVVIPEFDSFARPFTSISASGCSEWARQ